MSDLDAHLADLVVANRILAHERVVDAFGHVSIRHPQRPDRFFLSGARAPELVSRADLIEYDLECNPIDQNGRAMYAERPIHGAIYRARPDVMAVIHNHAYEVIPFTVTKVPLRPLLHTAGAIGARIPVWDIRSKFGTTDLLVRTLEQGRDLADCLAQNTVTLMRGHGCAVVGHTLKAAVSTAIYLMVNARLQSEAMRLGEVTFLSDEEVSETTKMATSPLGIDRAWEYWARRSGV